MEHDMSSPFYMYLAFMAVHDGCGDPKSGKQAPLQTVHTYYNRTVLDTYKVAGAMYTEMDSGIQTVIDALKSKSMWSNTILVSHRCSIFGLSDSLDNINDRSSSR